MNGKHISKRITLVIGAVMMILVTTTVARGVYNFNSKDSQVSSKNEIRDRAIKEAIVESLSKESSEELDEESELTDYINDSKKLNEENRIDIEVIEESKDPENIETKVSEEAESEIIEEIEEIIDVEDVEKKPVEFKVASRGQAEKILVKPEIIEEKPLKETQANEEPVKIEVAKQEVIVAVKEEPAKAKVLEEETVKEVEVKEEPAKAKVLKEETAKEVVVKEEPTKVKVLKEEIVKEVAVKEEPAKAEVLKEEAVKEETVKKEVVKEEVVKEKPISKPSNQLDGARSIVMKASAYDLSFESCGKRPGDRGYGITASGTKARPGVVAVDPKVIPLGTKLYIESMDGTGSYGYASAEDKGGAIKGNRIDLFFSSRSDALKFGRRQVKVYILDQK